MLQYAGATELVPAPALSNQVFDCRRLFFGCTSLSFLNVVSQQIWHLRQSIWYSTNLGLGLMQTDAMSRRREIEGGPK
jgi:hypothetical protein